mgnify:CR=1 FL=1
MVDRIAKLIAAIALAALCAFGGVRTVEGAFAWVWRKFVEDHREAE